MRRLMVFGAALMLGAAACGDDNSTGLVDVASVSLTPDSARSGAVLLVGDTLPLTVTAKDKSGNTLVGRAVSYISSNTAVATVTSDGKVIGVGEGSATVTASVANRNATATVNVIKPYTLVSVNGKALPVTLQGPQGPLTLNAGAVALYAANGKYYIRLRYAVGDPLIDFGTYTSGANGALTFTSTSTAGLVIPATLTGNTLTFNFGTATQPELWVFTK